MSEPSPMSRFGMVALALLAFAGLFGSLYGLFFYAIPTENRELIALLIGSFVTNTGAIVSAALKLRTGDKG